MRFLPLVVLLLVGLLGGFAASEDEMPTAEEMMKVMLEYGTPGKHHKQMAKFLGKWDVEFTMQMPGAPAMKSKGQAKFEWIMDGRWMSQRIKGTMMGMPYEAFGIHGFDNYRQNHVTTFVDNMGTGMYQSAGVPVDPTGKVTVQYGQLDEPTMKQVGKHYKVVTRLKDDNHFEVEIWDLGIGENGAMVIGYRYSRPQTD